MFIPAIHIFLSRKHTHVPHARIVLAQLFRWCNSKLKLSCQLFRKYSFQPAYQSHLRFASESCVHLLIEATAFWVSRLRENASHDFSQRSSMLVERGAATDASGFTFDSFVI